MTARNMNDPVAVYVELRETYGRERGQSRGTGTIARSEMFPRTSYADVEVIGMMFYDWINKGDFNRTETYYYWRERLRLILPDKAIVEQLMASGMNAPQAVAEVANRIGTTNRDWAGRTYEFNEDFWSLMEKAAIARFASGEVPTKWEMAKSAAWQAIKDLPGRIGAATIDVLPEFGLPSFGSLTKWTLIGIGGFGLYYLWKKRQR